MKKEQMKYEAPRVKVIACETEGVFCNSKSDEFNALSNEQMWDSEAEDW